MVFTASTSQGYLSALVFPSAPCGDQGLSGLRSVPGRSTRTLQVLKHPSEQADRCHHCGDQVGNKHREAKALIWLVS